jgi:hypothetical protein
MFILVIVTGLTMKLVGSSNHGYMHFKYEHNTNYQKIQKIFLEAVNSLDHNSVLVSIHSKMLLLSAVLVLVSASTLLHLKNCITLHSGCYAW